MNRQELRKLIEDAKAHDESITSIFEDENSIGYEIEEKDDYGQSEYYERSYYPDESSLSDRILIDDKIKDFMDVNEFEKFLKHRLDPNALMAMNDIAIVYDSDDVQSKVRDILEDKYGDEYAQYAGDDLLGLTWIDRQTLIINASAICESAIDVANDDGEWRSAEGIFMEGMLQTIFHESRHLLYDCNELVEIGKGTPYPWDGGMEENVEDYGNDMAEMYLGEFMKCIDVEKMTEFVRGEEKGQEKDVIAWSPDVCKGKDEKIQEKGRDFDELSI